MTAMYESLFTATLAITSFGTLWAGAGPIAATLAVLAGCIVGIPLAILGLILGWGVFELTLSMLDMLSMSPLDLIARRLSAALIGALLVGGLPGFVVCWLFLALFG